MTAPIVVVRDLVHVFGEQEVLHGVSLEVRPGELLGVVGPNGAGKTTLLHLMQGLIRPTSGSVTTWGAAAWPPDRRRNGRIGVQPQEPALFEQLTVREQLRLFARLRGSDPASTDVLAERFGLDECWTVRQERLSSGQRQRLSVASAMIGAPELVFLDEPTAGVDPVARRRMRSILREVISEGTALIYTSHDLNEVGGLCDRVVVMVAGRIIAADTPERLAKRSGLTTLEIRTNQLEQFSRLEIAGAVSVHVDDELLVLVSRDAVRAVSAVRAVDPDAQVVTRPEAFEDLYIRLVTQAEEREGLL